MALIGVRDAVELARYGVASLAGRVWLRSDDELREDGPEATAHEAVAHMRRASERFWLHIDLDVLRSEDFPAADYRQQGGLSWTELELCARAALRSPGCAGWSAVIYNPGLDPRRTSAARIFSFLAQTADASDGR